VVAESQHAKSFGEQKFVALCVTDFMRGVVVLSAVQFDNEFCRMRNKNNIRSYRRLTAKANAI